MQILEKASQGSAPVDLQSLWHFRAIPHEVQQCTVRRLALCGFPDHEIAARTGWSLEQVRQARQELVSPGIF
jgi:hypothetical protein